MRFYIKNVEKLKELKKDSNVKIRSCEVMQYFEYYDVCEIAVIVSRIKKLSFIRKFAVIIHDKDLLENGDLKKKHFHAILTFTNATTIGAVAKGLHVETQYVNKIRTTTKSAMLYLVHRNNPEKYQYDAKDVSANFDYVEYVDDCKPMQDRKNIADRIKNGEIKQYNLYDYISIDEFARNKGYYDKCFIFRQSLMKRLDRNLKCIFISGKSGTGKTTLAKDIAKAEKYTVYVSSGGKHPLDDYAGQECIILDDLRPKDYEYNDLLKLTDNHTDSLVGCRFYNKSIAECKLLIITTIEPIEDFADYWAKKNDTSKQLLRRFEEYITLDPYFIRFYKFNKQQSLFNENSIISENYVLVTKYDNYISRKYYTESGDDFIISLGSKLGLKPVEDD